MANKPNLPKSQKEILTGKEKKLDRSTQTRRDNDNVRDYSITLIDIDTALLYYMENIILPNVVNNGMSLKMPIIYGNPEKWKSVRQDGYYKDQKGKRQIPLMMFKRDSISRNRELSNKIDANFPQLSVPFLKQYTSRNAYSAFSALSNISPRREFHNIIIPEFVEITYTFMIWTDYVSQMNSIIEAINFSENGYWGEPERFKFRVRIDDYNSTTELPQDNDRIARTDFTLTLHGYLVPNSINKEISAHKQKAFSSKTIKFDTEIDNIPADTFYSAAVIPRTSVTRGGVAGTSISTGTGNGINISGSLFDYLMTEVAKNSDSIQGTDTAIFYSSSILNAPAPLNTIPTKENFKVFINGDFLPPTVITSIGAVGVNIHLIIDTGSLGYALDSNDILTAVGKFTPPSDTTL